MEEKINRQIRNYTESMFFGPSLRQFIFSVLACGVAVGLYFLLTPYVGTETVSWVCILGAAPFAALGFVKYNGMTAEKAISRKHIPGNLMSSAGTRLLILCRDKVMILIREAHSDLEITLV